MILFTQCAESCSFLKLLERDGHRCVFNGLPDIDHPALDALENSRAIRTIECRILPGAVVVFDADNRESKVVRLQIMKSFIPFD